mmetsp:Transcript_69359/g.112565  ORF Transcript_69359/g.112565 Transcript_69359/m.112565 type:complete len:233 (-) Transcript_69359:372-1070(-)
MADEDDHWQVATSAAVTMTLEELDLEAASSQKHWDKSYKNREMAQTDTSSAAALTFSTKSSRTGRGSLFDEDALDDSSTVDDTSSFNCRDFIPVGDEDDESRKVEYEEMDAALLHPVEADFLNDHDMPRDTSPYISAHAGSPLRNSAVSWNETKTTDVSYDVSSAPSCFADGGGGADAVEARSVWVGAGRVTVVSGKETSKLKGSSLFAGLEDDDGSADWLSGVSVKQKEIA